MVTGAAQVGAVAPSLDPAPVVKDTNFIRSAQVQFAKNYVGLVGGDFPQSIYNADSFVNGQVYATPDCSLDWRFDQILCDPGENQDNPYRLTRLNPNAGFTLYNVPQGNRGFVVIDLKEVRQFNTLRVFQMFSDGKVTDAALSTSSTISPNWPVYDDNSWTEVVPRSPVTAGAHSTSVGTCPTVFSFAPTTSRYVRLDLWNTGTHGSESYVEVAGAKLMYEDSAPSTAQSCPPVAPTAVNASYGNDKVTVSWTPPAGAVTSQVLQVSANSGSTWQDATSVPATLDGAAKTADVSLPPGQYVFRIKAVNLAGESPYSTVSNRVTVPTPTPRVKTKQVPVKPLNLPSRVRVSGWTRLLNLPVRTNAGQSATVRILVTPRLATTAGEQRFAIVSRKGGQLRVWLSGRPARIRLTISAPATADYTAYRMKKVWTT